MKFYNQNHEELKIIKVLAIGELYAIAIIENQYLPEHQKHFSNMVGLFIGDKDLLYLKLTFSEGWLHDLAEVAQNADLIWNKPKN